MSSCQKYCKKCIADTERYADGRCKPCTKEKNVRWALKNKDKVNARSRRWNTKNAEAKRNTNANYREKNQPLINERRRKKRALDPSGDRLQTAKRRKAKGTLPKDIVVTLLQRQNYKCVCCNVSLVAGYHLDHIVPISRGGSNTADNVQLLTPTCNLQKYNLTLEEFLTKRRKKNIAPQDN